MTSCAADLWDPVRFELQHTSIGSVATRGQPALDPMVFEAGLLGGPATATTLHPSSQTLIEEDPVSEKDSDKDGDAAEKPASDPMVLEAALQAVPPSTEHAPTQEDTTGATDNINTESAPATCMQRPLRPPRLHLRRAMEVSPARTELSARPTSLALLARRLMPCRPLQYQ